MHASIFNVATVTMATSTTNNVSSIAQRYEKERTATTNITDLSLSLNFPSFWLFNVIMSVCVYGMGWWVCMFFWNCIWLYYIFELVYLYGKLCTLCFWNRLSTLKSSQHTIQFTHLCLFFRHQIPCLWHSLLLLRSWDADDYNLFIYFNYTNFVDYRCITISLFVPKHWTREYCRRIVSLFCYCCSNTKWNLSQRKENEWNWRTGLPSLTNKSSKTEHNKMVMECEQDEATETEMNERTSVLSINYKWYYM